MAHYQLIYLVMLLIQSLHIFEEIGFEAYQVVGSLKKYLLAASVILLVSYLPLALMLLDLRWGIYLGFLPAALAVLNGVVHLGGLIKTGSYRATVGAGVFSGIPLAASGVLAFLSLLANI